MPTTSRVAPPSRSDHDLADHDLVDHDLADHDLTDHDLADHDLTDHDHADHVPSSSAEQLRPRPRRAREPNPGKE